MHRAGALLVGLAIVAALGWSFYNRPPTDEPETPPEPPRQREEFASDRGGAGEVPAAFDSRRAMGYLEKVCEIGARISGSEGMSRQQQMLKEHFEAHKATVTLQKFTARQYSQQNSVEMANLIASWHPDRQRRVIICTHYDTRPIADQEPDPRRWLDTFVSANDGGSGVALLMELAHHIGSMQTQVGVDFICFDGEEYIFRPRSDKYFFGSEYFANDYKRNRTANRRYVAGVLLDMIAGKSPAFPMEQYSVMRAGNLNQELWRIAKEQKCGAFQYRVGDAVQDDHLALNNAGIPTVDIIDFDYQHWHRLSDVPANCSAEGMEQVARVLTIWLQRVR